MIGIYVEVSPDEYDPTRDDYFEIALCDACAAKADEHGEAITYLYSDPDAVCGQCWKGD